MTQPTFAEGRRPSAWFGVVAFAASMMMVVGTFNVIYGFAAVFDDDIFVSGEEATLAFDLTFWGWAHVVFGVVLFVVGIGLVQGAAWAVLPAVILVMTNMVTQMFLLPAFPLWSILVIALDAVVLWAIVARGDERIDDL